MGNKIVRESIVHVGTGLIINYPLSLLVLYILLDIIEIENTFVIGTLVTLVLTITAFIRVLCIRSYYEKHK